DRDGAAAIHMHTIEADDDPGLFIGDADRTSRRSRDAGAGAGAAIDGILVGITVDVVVLVVEAAAAGDQPGIGDRDRPIDLITRRAVRGDDDAFAGIRASGLPLADDLPALGDVDVDGVGREDHEPVIAATDQAGAADIADID